MRHPLPRARRLAPVLPLLLMAACGAQPRERQIAARQQLVDPPALWKVESFDHYGRTSAVLQVCADRTVREGFGRAGAEINGESCVNLNGGVDRADLYAVRCQVAGRRYGVTVSKTGDPERDFTAAIAVTALDGSGVSARQTRRFLRLGPCPADWAIGDQARLDAATAFSALSGTWGGTR